MNDTEILHQILARLTALETTVQGVQDTVERIETDISADGDVSEIERSLDAISEQIDEALLRRDLDEIRRDYRRAAS